MRLVLALPTRLSSTTIGSGLVDRLPARSSPFNNACNSALLALLLGLMEKIIKNGLIPGQPKKFSRYNLPPTPPVLLIR
jgi:hypothetical protein